MRSDLSSASPAKPYLLAYLTAGTGIFAYFLVRAITLGVTYDESWSINGFVLRPVMDIVNYSPADANNHMINTLLIKLMFATGNESVFFARIPNVLAGMLYLWFAYKLTSRFLSPLTGICCFLLLILNPFVLDFFGLARGYGLSLGFMMCSLYYFVRFIREYRQRFASIALIMGALAVLSGFSMLHYWLALFGTVTLLPFLYRRLYPSRVKVLYNLLIAFGLLAFLWEPVRKLTENGSLYYGGPTSFYRDTLLSLVKYSFSYSSDELPWMINVLNAFLAVFLLSVLVAFLFSRKLHTPKNGLLTLLVLCVAAAILQHVLLGTLYVIDRTALYFFPLFVLVLCFSLNEFSGKWFAKGVLLIAVVLSAGNFFTKANFSKAAIWYFEAHSKAILETLNETGRKQHKILKVGYAWPFHSAFSYYTMRHHYGHIQLIEPAVDTAAVPVDDYYVFLNKSLEHVGYYDTKRYLARFPRRTPVMRFPKEHIWVLKIGK